jgi:hypothetical protein
MYDLHATTGRVSAIQLTGLYRETSMLTRRASARQSASCEALAAGAPKQIPNPEPPSTGAQVVEISAAGAQDVEGVGLTFGAQGVMEVVLTFLPPLPAPGASSERRPRRDEPRQGHRPAGG